MAVRRWLGNAEPVAEEKSVEVTSYDAATTYTLEINGKSVSTPGVTDADGTAEALADAWNALTSPEMSEVLATVDGAVITLLHNVAGVPFTVTSDDDGGTGTIGSPSSEVDATGPNFWDDANNWSGGAVPVNGDDVVFDFGNVSVLYGLDQSAVGLDSLKVLKGYTGNVGLPEFNEAGYTEYRDTYLAVESDVVEIGGGTGSGSGRIKLDTVDNVSAITIFDSGQPAETGVPAILWKSGAVANVVNVLKGDVGIATFASETAQVVTLRSGFVTSVAGDVSLNVGEGVSITNVEQSGGSVQIRSATTKIDVTGGQLEIFEGAHAEINVDEGTVFYRSEGTLTQGRIGSDGVLSFERDMRSRTVTDLELHERSSILDPFKTVTFTNPIELPRTGIEKLTSVNLGDNYTVQRGSI